MYFNLWSFSMKVNILRYAASLDYPEVLAALPTRKALIEEDSYGRPARQLQCSFAEDRWNSSWEFSEKAEVRHDRILSRLVFAQPHLFSSISGPGRYETSLSIRRSILQQVFENCVAKISFCRIKNPRRLTSLWTAEAAEPIVF